MLTSSRTSEQVRVLTLYLLVPRTRVCATILAPYGLRVGVVDQIEIQANIGGDLLTRRQRISAHVVLGRSSLGGHARAYLHRCRTVACCAEKGSAAVRTSCRPNGSDSLVWKVGVVDLWAYGQADDLSLNLVLCRNCCWSA